MATNTSEIAKAVADEIERRETENNKPLSPSASIWFITVVMGGIGIVASYVVIPTAQQFGIKTLPLSLLVGICVFSIIASTIITLLYGNKIDAYLKGTKEGRLT